MHFLTRVWSSTSSPVIMAPEAGFLEGLGEIGWKMGANKGKTNSQIHVEIVEEGELGWLGWEVSAVGGLVAILVRKSPQYGHLTMFSKFCKFWADFVVFFDFLRKLG